MRYYEIQERDFITQTKSIIEQYNFPQNENEEKLDIAILFNCLVGLLTLPDKQRIRDLSDKDINQAGWGIKVEDLEIIGGSSNSISNTARHMRNSISHYYFEIFSDEDVYVDGFRFKDFSRNNKLNFSATLSFAELKTFTLKLADAFLAQMN